MIGKEKWVTAYSGFWGFGVLGFWGSSISRLASSVSYEEWPMPCLADGLSSASCLQSFTTLPLLKMPQDSCPSQLRSTWSWRHRTLSSTRKSTHCLTNHWSTCSSPVFVICCRYQNSWRTSTWTSILHVHCGRRIFKCQNDCWTLWNTCLFRR